MPNITRYTLRTIQSMAWLSLLAIAIAILITTPAQANRSLADEMFADILSFAHMANAAYQTDPVILQNSAAPGYTLTHYSSLPETEVFYFLTTNDATKTHRIAVRGTANVENVLVNLNTQLVANDHTSIRLHQGFAQSAEGIYHAITPYLKPGYRIETTGHSLGGAVALALAIYLDADPLPGTRVITFGQPKITNADGARAYQHLNIIRVAMPKDIVPLVPFLNFIGSLRRPWERPDIYWPLGQEILLLEEKNYARLSEWNSLRRTTSFLNEYPSEENLRQHEMRNYLRVIRQKHPGAQQVSYQNNIRPFGWLRR